jgi:DNA-binding transcriptional MerR regulator
MQNAKPLMIGKLSELTGVSADTLRYYEKAGLLRAQARSRAGYRIYSPDAVNIIRFIRGAKELHFTLEEIRQLLALKNTDKATCAQILQHTESKIKEAETRILELKEIKKVLKELARQCPADESPTDCCPILDHISRKSKIILAALAVCGAMLMFPAAAMAKPIPYAGGWMIMQENGQFENLLHVVYAPSAHYSIGLSEERFRERDYWLHSAQFNYLVKRWNMPDAQANIFFLSGAGVAQKGDDTQPAAWGGLLGDYETRRVLVSYENHVIDAGPIDHMFWQKGRVGVAPYIGGYDDLHTWLMLQVEHQPGMNDSVVVTPLVRLFKGNILTEFGVSSNRRLLFNWNLTF